MELYEILKTDEIKNISALKNFYDEMKSKKYIYGKDGNLEHNDSLLYDYLVSTRKNYFYKNKNKKSAEEILEHSMKIKVDFTSNNNNEISVNKDEKVKPYKFIYYDKNIKNDNDLLYNDYFLKDEYNDKFSFFLYDDEKNTDDIKNVIAQRIKTYLDNIKITIEKKLESDDYFFNKEKGLSRGKDHKKAVEEEKSDSEFSEYPPHDAHGSVITQQLKRKRIFLTQNEDDDVDEIPRKYQALTPNMQLLSPDIPPPPPDNSFDGMKHLRNHYFEDYKKHETILNQLETIILKNEYEYKPLFLWTYDNNFTNYDVIDFLNKYNYYKLIGPYFDEWSFLKNKSILYFLINKHYYKKSNECERPLASLRLQRKENENENENKNFEITFNNYKVPFYHYFDYDIFKYIGCVFIYYDNTDVKQNTFPFAYILFIFEKNNEILIFNRRGYIMNKTYLYENSKVF